MDRPNLFSRGSTPPVPSQHQNIQQNNKNTTIDSLFQSISASSPDHPPPIDEVGPDDQPVTDRQNALLFSIDNTTRQPQQLPQQSQPQLQHQQSQQPSQPQHSSQAPQLQPSSQPQALQPQPQLQQVPTPPGSSQRSNASPPQTDTQQKLLEQLMSGSVSKTSCLAILTIFSLLRTSPRTTNYSESQRANPQPGPSPPYTQREEYRNYGQHDQASEASPRLQAVQHSHLTQLQQQQQQQQQQPPSPRKSMFEFTSPFDHLSVKKKPVSTAQPSTISSNNDDSTSWTAIPDPKRQSVENLLENLTRSQPPPTQAHLPAYETYLSGSDFSPPESVSTRAPLPPIPTTKAVLNRGPSPPKTQTLHRPQPRAPDLNSPSPHSQSPQSVTHGTPTRRDKESSPGPRGNSQRPQKNTAKFNNKSQSSPRYFFSYCEKHVSFLLTYYSVRKRRASSLTCHSPSTRFKVVNLLSRRLLLL